MSTSTALATVSELQPSPVSMGILSAATPGALVQGATVMAHALADIIRSQKLATRIQGREFVQVEGWTTLATMLGVVAREVATVEHPDEPGIFISTVELVRMADGAIISRASAECGAPDELDRYGKPVWANRPRYARRSMAQTRATGKACRLAFSWIMRLAGYEPTPAEEMPTDQPAAPAPPPAPTGAPQPGRHSGAPISAAQHRLLEARITAMGLDRERLKNWLARAWHVQHLAEIPAGKYAELLVRMESWAARDYAEEQQASGREEQSREEWLADYADASHGQ